MNAQNLLDVIGQAQDPYILSAMRTKKENAPAKQGFRTASLGRKILIAAAILMLLTLTACAAKYVGSLFVTYFQDDGRRELSHSQIGYIEEHTQPNIAQPIVTEGKNGYDLRVRSALTDGKIAYITMDIQAPEGTNLDSTDTQEVHIRFYENPLLIPEQTEGLVIAPDGSSPDAMCDYETIDDGDGLPHTASILFHVNPFTENGDINPFDGSIRWRIRAEGFEKSVFDYETCDWSHTPLGDGLWEFDLTFQNIDTREVAFVSDPVPILTSDWIRGNYDYENQITAFFLSGLHYRMQLAQPEVDGEMQDVGNVTIVMKDGTQQTLLCLTPQSGSLITPIVLDEVDHVLLCDGTKLYPLN